MEIKYTIQGLLVYAAIATYLMAFLATIARQRKVGHGLFIVGFVIATAAFGYRWIHVKHAPLQNLFEVFLSLGLLCYPLSMLFRKLLRIGGQWADMLIGAIVLFPAGFVFHAEPQYLPPALQSWLFVPHVAVYMLSYVIMAMAAFRAGIQLSGLGDKTMLESEQATYELVCIGFPLLTLGLVLGSIWGKRAWGDYWGWDPKELWSLVSWLVYIGYFHWRYMFGKRHPKINSLWAIVGMIAIVITLVWVNLSRLFPGLHNYAT